MLRVHPDREADLVAPEVVQVDPPLPALDYLDVHGNRCCRIAVPAGVDTVRLSLRSQIRDSGLPDAVVTDAWQHAPEELEPGTYAFLLPSRYCEVDSELLNFAWTQFGGSPLGWARVQAVCDYVHGHLRFDYGAARANRSALQAWHERVGVCRDFTHLAITLCRCLNIPARYVTGYLGDIGVPAAPYPMDYSAWFEVWLGGRWHTFDARHNTPRIGRVVIARGRDAADVPITMTFGAHTLQRFEVVTELAEA